MRADHRHEGRGAEDSSVFFESRGTPRAQPRATSSWSGVGSAVESRCWSSCPGRASARASRCSGWRFIQPKISVEAATAPSEAASRAPCLAWRGAREASRFAGGGREQERADEMGAAALVLLGGRRVRARRCRSRCARRRGRPRATPLRTRHHRRRDREQAGDELLRGVAQAGAADDVNGGRGAGHREHDAASLEGQLRLGQPALETRQEGEGLGKARRAAQQRDVDARADQALPLGGDLQLPVFGAHGARPRGGAVHQHAVPERHPTETELVRHITQGSRSARPRVAPADAERRRRGAARGRRRR